MFLANSHIITNGYKMFLANSFRQALCYNWICSVLTNQGKYLKDLDQGILQLQYNPQTVADQIYKVRLSSWSNLLQYQHWDKDNTIPLVGTYNSQTEHLRHIINKLQPVLQKDGRLKVAFGDYTFLS